MKPNTQAFIWTILMWLVIIGMGLLTCMAFAIDPYQTPYTEATRREIILLVASPFIIIWLIGIATIYIIGYIVGYIEKRENRERAKIEREFNK